MLKQVVLPFEITLAIFCIAVVVLFFVFRTAKSRTIAVLAACVLFIPSCTAVTIVVDQYRYGHFEYATAADAPHDGYIRLPPSATDIVLERHSAGHKAYFIVSTDELTEWIDEFERRHPNARKSEGTTFADVPDEMQHQVVGLERAGFEAKFRDFGAVYDPQLRKINLSLSNGGAGYEIWHLPSTGETYLDAGYW